MAKLLPRMSGRELPSSSAGEVGLGADEGGRGNGDDMKVRVEFQGVASIASEATYVAVSVQGIQLLWRSL